MGNKNNGRWVPAVLLAAAVFATPVILSATDLTPETLKGWNDHIQAASFQMKERAAGTRPFLWTDEAPGRRERARCGEILVAPIAEGSPLKVPHGLIHHWIGSMFIPDVTIDSVSTVLGEFERYQQIYNPAVMRAKLLEDSGTNKRFSIVLLEKAPFATAAIDSDYSSQTIALDQRRAYTISYSTRIQQIQNYGQPGEHELPADTGVGFVWRLYSIERFEESDGGVYVEFEAIALSRDIPFALQWLVKPIVQHLPRNSMVATLEKTRDAVRLTNAGKIQDLASIKAHPVAFAAPVGSLLGTP